MADNKNLKSLNRRELLEMLILQTRRVEELELTIKALDEKLESKVLNIEKAGSIAEAALSVNNVLDTAQKAADQYLENISRLQRDAEEAKAAADEKAKAIISEAEEERRKIIEEAQLEAGRILAGAKKKASANTGKKQKKKK